ncbi:ATP-binding cassette, subfamily B [Parafrankia irregularis]|uniref:ATP-binding cassette, subfamily B n=1 Tax=Parafrankia irregularis TaxID=795642 RepID=A0A0S4QMB1_9ACTN|nr:MULTISPECIES: ABC transporter ATP-binding protein [Parafrankia]MBE3200463.1 ABC transporter ATP-binding protein [Parafrankia sp. CH37]CUU56789.1 ATP-binding cassette, subfamily B [Parafrankia irregularis]
MVKVTAPPHDADADTADADTDDAAADRTAADQTAAELAELRRAVRGRIGVAAVLQALAAVLSIAPAVVLVEIARRLLNDEGRSVWSLAWLAAGLLLARFVLYASASLLSHLADADLAYLLRRRMTEHVSALPLSWFAGGVSARVRSTVQDDVGSLHHAVAHARADLASAVAGPTVVIIYLLWVDWTLALVTVALIAVAQTIRSRLAVRATDQVNRIAAANSELTAAVLETVRGISVVKAFAADQSSRRFTAAAAEHADADEQAQRIFLRPRGVARATVAPATVVFVVTAVGTGLVAAGWTDPVDLVAFILLGVGLFEQITPIYLAQDLRERAQDAAGRISGLLREPRQPEVDPIRARTVGIPPTVELDDVHFAYPDGREVLHGVSATLRPGTVTALVGSSGAGKSTLAMLMARFADVTAGTIRLGGADLRDIDRDELYRHIGFLLQDVVLLRRTIRDNIALAVPDASDEAVRAAARAAAVDDRVLALPRGYDSVVGEDAHLSGGEAQRIAIARTLLAGTPIVLLDEATAFADPDSEAAIQDALAELAAGRTLLVIAHRLYTVTAADQILVLDDGRIVERGRHDDLLAAGGRYAQLWRAQQSDREGRA